MPPEILNTLSYLMGLALMFSVGVHVGVSLHRRALFNAMANGVQRVENLFTNLFKRGENAKTQADHPDHATHYYDGIGSVNSPPWEKIRQDGLEGKAGAAGLGNRAPADHKGAGQQGRESVGGETCGDEGGEGRAGNAA